MQGDDVAFLQLRLRQLGFDVSVDEHWVLQPKKCKAKSLTNQLEE
jgi:hypothetical protein